MKTVLILLKEQQIQLKTQKRLSPETLGRAQNMSKYTFVENVIPHLLNWKQQGLKNTLVTLVDREGSSPRPIGAQMAINENGDAVGHIATDCLHDALILEAQSVMSSKQNKLIRFGKGSPYIDLKLPCGSGIDLYFDQALSKEHLEKMQTLLSDRKAFTLSMNMSEGRSEIQEIKKGSKNERSASNKMIMQRNYFPELQLLILGNGPTVINMATVARDVKIKVQICASETDLQSLAHSEGFETESDTELNNIAENFVDDFTAVVFLFHDHEKELPLYQPILDKSPFYIGAMGSHTTHEQRLETLKSLGLKNEALKKIKGPIGIIPVAKNPDLLALSVISEIMNEAQNKDFIC